MPDGNIDSKCGKPESGLRMSNHAIEEAYKALKNGEPQTPNEIAVVIGMNQKTVQMALMKLVSTKPDVKWKKIGRYRLFWKEKRGRSEAELNRNWKLDSKR